MARPFIREPDLPNTIIAGKRGLVDCVSCLLFRNLNNRHSFASHAVMRGIPLPVVSRLLGHAYPRMAFRYAHVSDQETEGAAERIGVAVAAMLAQPTPSAPGRRHRKTVMRVAGSAL